jgi:UDP-N-acetyl-D-mannosaminuronic acid transferase (WecB/TagA/CpsF family)
VLLLLLLSPAAIPCLLSAPTSQAEAAAKLAKYQQGLRQLLSDIGKTGNIADDAQLLYKLADQLFGSPLNVCELVGQGGVPVILAAARSARQALVGGAARVDVLPALMQVGHHHHFAVFLPRF